MFTTGEQKNGKKGCMALRLSPLPESSRHRHGRIIEDNYIYIFHSIQLTNQHPFAFLTLFFYNNSVRAMWTYNRIVQHSNFSQEINMSNRLHNYFAGILAILGWLALAVVAYLTFVFPKTSALWADRAQALTGFEQLLVNLSQVCGSFGLIIIPALLLLTVGCLVWVVLSGKKTATN